MRRRDKIISIGDDYRRWPKKWWGSRDWERERGRELVEAMKPKAKSFTPLPGAPVNLSITSLYAEPRPVPKPRDPDAWADAWFRPRR